jgi:hypothetical protein
MRKILFIIPLIIITNVLGYTYISKTDSVDQLCIRASDKLISNFERELEIATSVSNENDNIADFFDEFCFHAQVISNE